MYEFNINAKKYETILDFLLKIRKIFLSSDSDIADRSDGGGSDGDQGIWGLLCILDT